MSCHFVSGQLCGHLHKSYAADGSISTTFLLCLSSDECVSDAQTVYSSCSQMFCSDILIQSGVGMNSSCGGVFIGDTCMMFCAEGYQVVSNDTSTLTCACDRRDNSLCLFFGVNFSDCFSLTYCRPIHLPHATFSHVQSLYRSHSTDDMCAWLKFELRHPKKSYIHASCFTLRLTAH